MSERKHLLMIVLILAAWGSMSSAGEITGIQDVCDRPELLNRLPDYMKEMCKTLKSRFSIQTKQLENERLLVQRNVNGQPLPDEILPFPKGSTISIDDYPENDPEAYKVKRVIVNPPHSDASDTLEERNTAI